MTGNNSCLPLRASCKPGREMKTVPLGSLGLAFVVSVHVGFLTTARAQDGEPQPIVSRALAATVDYGNDAIFQPAKHGTDFDQLGLDPGQTVNITVWFPIELAGEAMLVEAPDGGAAVFPEAGLIVTSDGTVTFQFQAGDLPGACRLIVHQPDDTNTLNFWVIDLEHPENNPSELPGAY